MKKLLTLIFIALMVTVPAFSQTSTQGALTASGATCATANACVQFQVPSNLQGASLQVSGTYVGTIAFEALLPQPANGVISVTQASIAGTPLAGGVVATGPSANATGTWQFGVGGVQTLIARMSAYTSGTAVITIAATNGDVPATNTTSGGGAVTLASGAVASGAYSSGSIASGAFASGALASGSVASGAIASGAVAAGAYAAQSFAVGAIPPAAGTLASGAVTSAMTGTTSTSVIGATASNYIYITNCVTSNASTTVPTDIILQDGSGGTTLYTLPDPMGTGTGTGVAGGTFSFPVPLKVPTAGNALFAANVTTGSSTKISCSGFKSTVSY